MYVSHSQSWVVYGIVLPPPLFDRPPFKHFAPPLRFVSDWSATYAASPLLQAVLERGAAPWLSWCTNTTRVYGRCMILTVLVYSELELFTNS